MPIDLPSPSALTEGTSLPPPRPFGDAGTLTLKTGRGALAGGDSVIALGAMPAAATGQQVLRVAIMPAPVGAITVTF